MPMYMLEDERIEVEGRSSAKVETRVVLYLLGGQKPLQPHI
jgi:hypothetical protein